jgi:hypothetical protein
MTRFRIDWRIPSAAFLAVCLALLVGCPTNEGRVGSPKAVSPAAPLTR